MSATLLIDECVNGKIVLPSFTARTKCIYVKALSRGADDVEVLGLARQHGCILLTEDAGFGRLVFARRLPPPKGVILVTMPNHTDEERRGRVQAEAAAAVTAADGAFVVIDFEKLRIRPFPP